MDNKQLLIMKYHPAKKEIEFHRYQNGKEVPIRDTSKLRQYMNMKGKFILQDHGNQFLEDIANVFDGLKTIDIKVITTKLDYNDFEQMVEFYNKESEKFRFNTSLEIELPNMAETFSEVKKHGEKALETLEKHKKTLCEVDSDFEKVQETREIFYDQIEEEISIIKEKINSLNDSNVSICFAGVYSAGKSALINAILGHKILPEKVSSETAKMFMILSPENNESISIRFKIIDSNGNEDAILEWNQDLNCFEFVTGPLEIQIRTEIQEVLNQLKDDNKNLYEQINSILTKLNMSGEISSEITVKFPVPLDTESVQYTIYDTPGTDSNVESHQVILSEALSEQTKSILIFVIHPHKLEGEGNNALLDYLKKNEQNSRITSIDLARSIFVINHVDTIDKNDRKQLQSGIIKDKSEDGSFTIDLSDKKLFFTSAKYALIAKEAIIGSGPDVGSKVFKKATKIFNDPDDECFQCFLQDKYATSEVATEKLIRTCKEAYSEAEKNNDEVTQLYINTGLYAIEREINQYGEKYASAVKAFAIINSVDKALTRLRNTAINLQANSKKDINDIIKDINELEKTINRSISESMQKLEIPEPKDISEEDIKSLHLNSEYLYQQIDLLALNKIEKGLNKGLFSIFGKAKVNKNDEAKFRNIVSGLLNKITSEYKYSREELLTKKRDEFICAVRKAIIENGEISKEAREYILSIPAPEISHFDRPREFNRIFNSYLQKYKFFFFKLEYIDKTGFLDDLRAHLQGVTGRMYDDYGRDYRNSLNSLLEEIQDSFQTNLAKYSVTMNELIEDRKAMERLEKRMQNAADDLEKCQIELNDIIWRGVSND